MYKFWLIFAQTATVCLGILFVVSTLRPDMLPDKLRDNGQTPATQRLLSTTTTTRGADARLVSFNEAVRKAMPAVVSIFTSKEVKQQLHPFADDPMFRYLFGNQLGAQTQRITGLGSGVIINAEGYVLTNQHVVEAADEIEVALADGRRSQAHVVGSDPDTDLAVLKINLKNLPAITFAQSEQARVGDIVLAIGNPFGVGETVTSGIISALGRHFGMSAFESFIQTDAAINPGNSGGALVDSNGDLLGINSAIYTRSGGSQGIGFAIPSSLAAQVMQEIIAHGSVTRGWVGIGVENLTPELSETLKLPKITGALITEVVNGGPADNANVKPGDILIAVDGRPVTDYSSTLNLIAALKPGGTTTLKVVRDGKELDLKAVIGKRPKQQLDPEQDG
ncbi:MAG TPA: trypsin-like peptidase domain-containing protein [Phycisphaerae bacterium]|jgi:serine protease DegQ|nr:trypsin-like peptidase domain-containing protein [Phycisphaerae bacterium]